MEAALAGARRDTDEHCHVEGTEEARLQVLRTDDCLCLRAGRRNRQRPSCDLSSPQDLLRIGAKQKLIIKHRYALLTARNQCSATLSAHASHVARIVSSPFQF